MKPLFIFFFVLININLISCNNEKNNQDFIINDCSKDTLIKVNNLRGSYATRNISLKVIGTIDDSSHIFVKDVIDKSNSGIIDFHLGKGEINFKEKGEIYSQDYEIIFLHNKATKGQLKIRLQLLSPNGDTLTDNQ